MKPTPTSCPECGAQRRSSSRGDYCPACYLSVGLEGIDIAPEDSLDHIAEKPGDSIGRFELIEQIGEGGFGVVFRAIQRQPVRRILALKVIKPGMDSREVVARFEAERQALALMDHPHIAKVYDAGTTALGRPFFVMELVEGLPLTTFCDENKLSIEQRLELFMRICAGVQHAHQKGVIHRDLKPSNVLVHFNDDGEPCPKIIDFGVAKAIGIELTEQTFFTLFGRLVGTPEYMSPEQAELNALDVDTRSDIYSLGVLLHELLTGCVPLSREVLTKGGYDEMRRLIREQEPLIPSKHFAALETEKRKRIAEARQTEAPRLERQLRGELDWITLKAIDKNRARRYETAQGLSLDVDRFMKGLPVNAGPPSTAYRVGKFVGRNRAGVLIASLTVLALIIGIIASVAAYRAQLEANRETLISKAEGKRKGKESGWRSSSLGAILEASKIKVDEDIRNEALACLAGSDMEEILPGQPLGDRLIPVTFDPSHRFSAFAWSSDRIEIMDRTTNKLLATVSTQLPLTKSRLSFAGEESRYLIIASASAAKSRLEVIDWRKGSTSMPPTELSHQAFDLLPKHQGLVIGRPNSIVFLDWQGKSLRPLLALPDTPIALDLMPGGKNLAIGLKSPSGNVREGRLLILDSQSGDEIQSRSGFEPWTLSWSPSGQFLVMGDADGSLDLLEPGVLNSSHSLEGHLAKIQTITWSPDGRLFASSSSDWEIRLWDGRHGSLCSTHKANAENFSFSPDGTQLGPVIWEQNLFTLAISQSKVCHRAVGHPGGRGEDGIIASAWDSRVSEERKGTKHEVDERYSLAFATAGNGSVILWSRTGEVFARFEDVTNPAGLAFSESWLYIAGEEGIVRRGLSITDMKPFGPFLEKDITPCVMHFEGAKPFSDLTHCQQIAVTPDGGILIAASDSGIWIVDTNDESKQLIQEAEADTTFAIDSEGKWLAIGCSDSRGDSPLEVRVYSLPKSGEHYPAGAKPIKVLPALGATSVAFSQVMEGEKSGKSDRVLLATGDSTKYRFWSANDDWQELPELEIDNHMADIPGKMVFSPRSTALAISHQRDELKVLNPRETPMVVLTRPNFDKQWPLAISSDGALIGTEGRDGRLFIWDLKAVRDEFGEMGFDWKMKDFKIPHDMHILIGVTVDK